MPEYLKPVIVITALAACIATSNLPARADDGGAVAAGVAGGLLGGLLLGGAVAPRPYYGPAPVYVEPPPPRAYCYWTRGEPVWDDYRGVWIRPRVRVCE
jgi:hypothetical protein